ncbi:MAG: ribosomal protein S18-alanine N-acetyltransferase [Chloroflexi bacterium]|nr:ribosomal protein S18-alanine N-acetyltransferase [Chloroflexota bacterium]
MITIQPMTVADIPQVVEIDYLSFPLPWSANSYRHELLENDDAHFFVAVDGERRGWRSWLGLKEARRVVGFVGYWYIVDEAHISTIAVHPTRRQTGVGERLLRTALEHALSLGAQLATLEVRQSNAAAQNLYRKYCFEEVGRRKGYYRDNGEDALLMTAKPIRLNLQIAMQKS